MIGTKPLRISFDEIDGFIRICDGNRYLSLLGSESYDDIYNKIIYLRSLKSGITYVFSHFHVKINDFLLQEKILILHNAIRLSKSVLNKY